jgi:amidase
VQCKDGAFGDFKAAETLRARLCSKEWKMKHDIERLLIGGSIDEIGGAFRSGTLAIEEAADWFEARIRALDGAGPKLNTVRTLSPNLAGDARKLAAELKGGHDRGPLHGMPVLLKDNILTADGMSATAGSAALADFKPSREAFLVRRLREAGALILGKTNMTEFADYVSDVMPSEFSSAGGVVRNPHGLPYGRGQGSSVGSAAAVAASLCVFAIGSETQNSLQSPATHSSVAGYKPSVGLVSRSGIVPLVPSQDSPSPLTRGITDAWRVLQAIAGPDGCDQLSLLAQPARVGEGRHREIRGLRIGVPRRAQADRPEFAGIIADFEALLSVLSKAGAVIIDPCDLPSAEQLSDVRSSVFRCEFKSALNAFLADNDSPCGMHNLDDIIAWNSAHPQAIPYGQPLLLAANGTTLDEQYMRDRRRDVVLSRQAGIDAALAAGDVDLLIAPMAAAAKCTGKAGAPVAAIPAGLNSQGAPFGVTLYASPGSDWRLLDMAAAVEEVIGKRHVPKL